MRWFRSAPQPLPSLDTGLFAPMEPYITERSNDVTQLDRLAPHLRSLCTGAQQRAGHAWAIANSQAQSILADPQGHIDALVEAGVLMIESCTMKKGSEKYRVLQPEPPHVHEWEIYCFSSDWDLMVR